MARRFGSAKSVHKRNERDDRSNATFYLRAARTAVRKGWCGRAIEDGLRAAILVGRADGERQAQRKYGARSMPKAFGIKALSKALHKCLIDRDNRR